MRKLALVVALASTALATQAFARDGAPYVGVEGGPMIVEDTNIDISGVNNGVKVDNRYGGDFDAIAGYDFGMFRVEGEIGYKRANVKRFTTGTNLPGVLRSRPAVSAFRGHLFSAAGRSTALSGMVNAMLDFGADTGVSGFVGGGAGYARVKFENYSLYSNTGVFLDGRDDKFAWQAIAGVRAPVTSNIDVGLKYRFFNVDHIHMAAFDGSRTNARFRSHSLLGSLIFNFGEKAPPPPPPPPPAPPLRRPRRLKRHRLLLRRR